MGYARFCCPSNGWRRYGLPSAFRLYTNLAPLLQLWLVSRRASLRSTESFPFPLCDTEIRQLSAISRMTLRRCFSEAKDHTRLPIALYIWHWSFPELRLDLSSAHIKIGTVRRRCLTPPILPDLVILSCRH